MNLALLGCQKAPSGSQTWLAGKFSFQFRISDGQSSLRNHKFLLTEIYWPTLINHAKSLVNSDKSWQRINSDDDFYKITMIYLFIIICHYWSDFNHLKSLLYLLKSLTMAPPPWRPGRSSPCVPGDCPGAPSASKALRAARRPGAFYGIAVGSWSPGSLVRWKAWRCVPHGFGNWKCWVYIFPMIASHLIGIMIINHWVC